MNEISKDPGIQYEPGDPRALPDDEYEKWQDKYNADAARQIAREAEYQQAGVDAWKNKLNELEAEREGADTTGDGL